jgi:nitrite reductase (NAD(P)H)
MPTERLCQEVAVPLIEPIVERGQIRPADWPKAFPPATFEAAQIPTPKDRWQWRKVAKIVDLPPTNAGTTFALYC